MYKKAILSLFALHLVFALVILNVKLSELQRAAANNKFKEGANYISVVKKAYTADFYEEGSVIESVTGQRVISYGVIQNDNQIILSMEDLDILRRIVQAEAGNQDELGKMLVANVVLNRVQNPKFPGNVREVVYQGSGGVSQFSPVKSGAIDRVKVSKETKEAVDKVLSGKDDSKGALYFASRNAAAPQNMAWFDSHLTYLFKHGGHEFFK